MGCWAGVEGSGVGGGHGGAHGSASLHRCAEACLTLLRCCHCHQSALMKPCVRRQEVPYTHRRHAIMMVSNRMEKNIGEQTFREVRVAQRQEPCASCLHNTFMVPARCFCLLKLSHPWLWLSSNVAVLVVCCATLCAGYTAGGCDPHPAAAVTSVL